MATITKKLTKNASNRLGAAPWGNMAAFTYKLETNSSGAVIGSDAAQGSSTPAGTVIRVGILPAGFKLVDFKATVGTAMTTTITADVGFAYVDGVDDSSVPQDADYFVAAGATTVGVLRQATTVPQVTLPKDAWLTVTTAVAANAKASSIELIVLAVAEGVK
ncbi:MAG: hypothetical protein WC322_00145 [Candidatus Paceibacterota bacterium]|jgi:hypothetical protein